VTASRSLSSRAQNACCSEAGTPIYGFRDVSTWVCVVLSLLGLTDIDNVFSFLSFAWDCTVVVALCASGNFGMLDTVVIDNSMDNFLCSSCT